ncbi:aldo/keto reductase [Kitasatospora sp. NPDC004799]|uniref:aldo/keto reductase n=1 Tax=Kitasatospora sp. NPDC004799 TaxID=3154460 RepID=UPI0033B00651
MDIETRTLARELTVNPVAVGCWAIGGPGHNLGLPMGWANVDERESLRGLRQAHYLGANLFDTADVYGHGRSERLIGKFLAGVDRDSVVLSSKVGYFAGTAEHAYERTHMRHQLETTLRNLGTDHLDVYFLHNSSFGERDRYLEGAVEQMHAFRQEGLIRAVGMRGPHRLATDRLSPPKGEREDKRARFRTLFDIVRPDYLAVRFNALTPLVGDGEEDLFAFAAARGASVLANKPLAQGLLTGKYHPDRPPVFGDGDIRRRKAWFTQPFLRIIEDGLEPLRERFGPSQADLARVAIRYVLQHAENCAVLVGFTRVEQVEQNLLCLGDELTSDDMAFIREATGRLQQQLDAAGEVFLDELEKP